VGSSKLFDRFSHFTGHLAGQPITFIAAVSLVLVWAVSGPFFGFSETWQLVINTGTTIITFLMVFIVQNSQNRDGLAIQAKLDELIRANKGAQDEFIGSDLLSEKELDDLRKLCADRAAKKNIGHTLRIVAPEPKEEEKVAAN
jgi:low affinity Fe/Cu permease